MLTALVARTSLLAGRRLTTSPRRELGLLGKAHELARVCAHRFLRIDEPIVEGIQACRARPDDYDEVLFLAVNMRSVVDHTGIGYRHEDSVRYFTWLLDRAILRPDNHTRVFKDLNRGGRIVGYRLCSVRIRDDPDTWPPPIELCPSYQSILRVLDHLDTKLFMLRPEAMKVARLDGTFVVPTYRRRGIVRHFLGVNDERCMREEGIDGIVGMITSYKMYKMATRGAVRLFFGWHEIYRAPRKLYVDGDDRLIDIDEGLDAAAALIYKSLK